MTNKQAFYKLKINTNKQKSPIKIPKNTSHLISVLIRKNNSQRYNQCGAMVVLLPIIAILLFTIFILAYGHYQSLSFHQIIYHQCRKQTTELHKKIGKDLSSVLELNQPLRWYRLKQKIGEMLMKSGDPYTAAFGASLYAFSTKKLNIISNTQNLLIMKARVHWIKQTLIIQRSLNRNERVLYEFSTTVLPPIKFSPDIPVRRAVHGDPFSPIILDSDFESKMRLTFVWIQKGKLIASSWLNSSGSLKTESPYPIQTVTRGCQSRLIPKGLKDFQVQLGYPTEDPYLSNVRWFY